MQREITTLFSEGQSAFPSTLTQKTATNFFRGGLFALRFIFQFIKRGDDYSSLSRRMFIISQAALATEVPGPKIAATPAL